MKNIKIVIFVFITFSFVAQAQIKSARIVFHRKTNLYKKFKNDNPKDWIKEADKNKLDSFELVFNDSLSVFKPIESDLREQMSWATSKNSVYQNFNSNERFTVKSIWGEQINLKDSLFKRTWKITNGTRNICGYNCRKAIWIMPDSSKIYAWYCNEIETSTGPESFYGLPGAILGVATEDGGVIYFAKRVEVMQVKAEELLAPKTKQKIYESGELRKKLEKEYGKEPWGKAMIKETFGIT